MDRIASALQGELRQTLDRLRDLGGAVIFEDYPGALEQGADGEVGGDSVSASEERGAELHRPGPPRRPGQPARRCAGPAAVG